MRAVTGGLAADDKVIIGGLANPFVHPGATVQPQPGVVTPVEPAVIAAKAPDTGPLQVKARDELKPSAN